MLLLNVHFSMCMMCIIVHFYNVHDLLLCLSISPMSLFHNASLRASIIKCIKQLHAYSINLASA